MKKKKRKKGNVKLDYFSFYSEDALFAGKNFILFYVLPKIL